MRHRQLFVPTRQSIHAAPEVLPAGFPRFRYRRGYEHRTHNLSKIAAAQSCASVADLMRCRPRLQKATLSLALENQDAYETMARGAQTRWVEHCRREKAVRTEGH